MFDSSCLSMFDSTASGRRVRGESLNAVNNDDDNSNDNDNVFIQNNNDDNNN